MESVQAQWKRNFDGLERLMQARSVQEFGTILGELVREDLEHILKDSRSIAERSMRAADEVGKALAAMADREPPTCRRDTLQASVSSTIRGRSSVDMAFLPSRLMAAATGPFAAALRAKRWHRSALPLGFTSSVTGIGPSCVVANVRDGLPTVVAPR